MALLAVAGATIAGTLGASLGAASIQSNTSEDLNQKNLDFQQKQFDYTKSLTTQGLQSYRDAGLPDFMYWSRSSMPQNEYPNTSFHLGGSNFVEGLGVNSSLPYYTTSPYSQWSKAGKPQVQEQTPSPSSRQASVKLPSSNGQVNGNTSSSGSSPSYSFVSGGNLFAGQNDKVGLGNGRYSAVEPPTLSYNSRGVGTTVNTRDFGVQGSTTQRTSFAQTPSWMENYSPTYTWE